MADDLDALREAARAHGLTRRQVRERAVELFGEGAAWSSLDWARRWTLVCAIEPTTLGPYGHSMEPFLMGRTVVSIEAAEDGFVALCDCGALTHVVTIRSDADGRFIPTPMEFAFTCDGCLSSHWLRIIPDEADS